MRDERTEVLVVGAGPVGLFTALLMAEAGFQVNIIDREQRTTARSYACALHPETLRLFARLKLTDSLQEHGRKIPSFAFYDHETRRAELNFSELEGDFPYLLILPQSTVESVLEQRLRQAGVNVLWNHRLDSLSDDTEEVVATVEELGGTSTGYIVPHWEMVVKRRSEVRASLVVGADGRHSAARRALGIESQRVTGPLYFAAYEFESDPGTPDELRVVLDNTTTNVLWPLPGNKYRWTFQLAQSHLTEFPEKERRSVRVAQPQIDEKIKEFVQRAAKNRAPWFSATVKEIAWCTEVIFELQHAKQFGRNRIWLAGDAAHQAGPVGVQSMNVGFLEAEMLANCALKVLRQYAQPSVFDDYDRHWQAEWKRLLGLTGGLNTRSNTNPWVRERAPRILPCLPASNGDLTRLADQLALDYP